MIIAQRLIEMRVSKKLSLQAVADASGVSRQAIWDIEKGKTKNPSMEIIINLAKFYNVSIDELVGLKNENSQLDEFSIFFRDLNFIPANPSEDDKTIIKNAIEMACALIIQNRKTTVAS